jgi:hypothetical protein
LRAAFVFGYHVDNAGGLALYVEWAAAVYFPACVDVP